MILPLELNEVVFLNPINLSHTGTVILKQVNNPYEEELLLNNLRKST
jgi:hypothetical protein